MAKTAKTLKIYVYSVLYPHQNGWKTTEWHDKLVVNTLLVRSVNHQARFAREYVRERFVYMTSARTYMFLVQKPDGKHRAFLYRAMFDNEQNMAFTDKIVEYINE